jgi:hypothetical protein
MNEPSASINWLAGWGTGSWTVTFVSGKPFINHLSESLGTKALFICPGRRPNNYVCKLTFLVRRLYHEPAS